MFAHAVWSIDDGSILTPMGFSANTKNEKEMQRFVDDQHYENAVDMAKKYLEKESLNHKYVAIYFDGYYTFSNGEKMDALYMIAKINTPEKNGEITMALPYQKKKFLKPLKIYKPKLIGLTGISEEEMTKNYDFFWSGIDSHPKGSKVWNKAIDQSK